MACDIQKTKNFKCVGCAESFQTSDPNVVMKKVNDSSVSIKINRYFTFDAHPEFLELGQKCLLDSNIKTIDINFQHIETIDQIDSSAIGMILLLHEKFPKVKFNFINTNDQIQKIIEITKLVDRVAPI